MKIELKKENVEKLKEFFERTIIFVKNISETVKNKQKFGKPKRKK